mgnify:CR=1 FL=1
MSADLPLRTRATQPDRPRAVEQRRTVRYAVDEPALVIVGKHALACRMNDISLGGAMLEGPLPLKTEDHFRLMVLDLPELVCRVAHVGDGFLGVSFVNGQQINRSLGMWIRKRCRVEEL